MTPFTTSASLALVADAPLALVDGRFSAVLPARSITSFVADSGTN